MTEIRIDGEKAQRMIAQILRDEQKLSPAAANDLASTICRRLSCAMMLPAIQQLAGYRMIRQLPFVDFDQALAEVIVNSRFSREVSRQRGVEVWNLVYDRAEDLPAGVADAARY